jgi:serine/threonine protein phosphatase PrpC
VLSIRIASRSCIGGRDDNEDDLRTGQHNGVAFAVLSDGAGGHRNGAVASDLVVRVVTLALQSQLELSPQVLHSVVHDAQEVLLRQQAGAVERERMHATLVALWIDAASDQALWSHVGDSRLYLLRQGKVHYVTRDDSAVRQMVDAGFITPEAAQLHPKRHQLLCAMGVESGFVAHTLERAYALSAGDVFLLCSDGWWENLERAEIEHTLGAARSPEQWLASMESIISADASPEQDNHSAVAVWVGEAVL